MTSARLRSPPWSGAQRSPNPRRLAAPSSPPRRRLARSSASGSQLFPASAPPPPPPAAGDSIISYVLRNRLVVAPSTSKHIVPCTSRSAHKTEKEPKYAPSRQTPTCAQMGLEHYNSINQGDEHELVKAVESNAFVFNGVWIHANFLAKRKGGTSCDDLAPKYFFAELKTTYEGFSCVSCVKIDPGMPGKLGGCGVCPRQIMHPADGGYRNAQPFNESAAIAKRCIYSF